MPTPPLPTRFAVLAGLLVAGFWFGFLSAFGRHALMLKFAASAYAIVLFAPIPVALLAGIIGWNVKYFRQGYIAAFSIAVALALFAIVAESFVGKGISRGEYARNFGLFDPAAGVVYSALILVGWAAGEIAAYLFCWSRMAGAGTTDNTLTLPKKRWWGVPSAAILLAVVNFVNFDPPREPPKFTDFLVNP